MNTDEARAEAWLEHREEMRAQRASGDGFPTMEEAHQAGWDARGRYDEQRIAELERELAAANTLLKTTLALRALGQSEEVENG